MFEFREKEKEEIKGLLDRSDTPIDFLYKLMEYSYANGYSDCRNEKIYQIITENMIRSK